MKARNSSALGIRNDFKPWTMKKPSAYTHFFGFSQKPFSPELDLESLFLIKSHKEALVSIVQGINERRGIVLLLGKPGTGKTTLLHSLQVKLAKKVKTVFISRVSIFFKQVLKQIAQELGLPSAEETPGFFLSQLRDYLAEGLGRRENLTIFIDDAQNLTQDNFEELGLLSSMREEGVGLVQIVLAGRPELENILSAEALRPLEKQIWTRLWIQPLLPEESRLFIEQRLQKAGRSAREVFAPEALDLMVSEGGGIFRNLIFLGDKALRKGADLQKKLIDPAIVREIRPEMTALYGENLGQSPEVIDRDDLLRRLFQNPPRIMKTGILQETIFFLKRRFSYLYIIGTLGLALAFYAGWEFLLTPSPSVNQRTGIPAPAVQEQKPIPAAQEKEEAVPQKASPSRPEKKPEMVQPAPERARALPLAAGLQARANAEEKPAGPTPPKPPPPAVSKKEPKAELITGIKREIRFNEPIEVPKGKTLYSFARDYYQDANHSLVDFILEANPHIKDMDRIPTDQRILIPEVLEGSLLSQSPDGSWKIRLGTFEKREAQKAFQEVPVLKEKEIDILPLRVSPQTVWYRLYAGKFDTMEEAFKATQELRKKGLLPALKK